MMCEICDKEAIDNRGFCAVHLALWLRYVNAIVYRHASREGVRAWFVKWQRGK